MARMKPLLWLLLGLGLVTSMHAGRSTRSRYEEIASEPFP